MNKTPVLTLTVGISASGKTTWAENFCSWNPNTVNINRDDIRFKVLKLGTGWHDYKLKKSSENLVSEYARTMFKEAVSKRQWVIISDTNLSEQTINYWKTQAKENGYLFAMKFFEVSYDEAVARDLRRGTFAVGSDVIARQWKRWLEVAQAYKYEPLPAAIDAIIVDVDGTVATMTGRSAFEWSKVHQDQPRQSVIDMIKAYLSCHPKTELVFLSGRDEVCYEATCKWLSKHFNIKYDAITLFMRPESDKRKDYIVKQELFKRYIAPYYNVVAAFDDRPQVVDMWYDIGIPTVFCVADQRIRF